MNEFWSLQLQGLGCSCSLLQPTRRCVVEAEVSVAEVDSMALRRGAFTVLQLEVFMELQLPRMLSTGTATTGTIITMATPMS